MRLPLRSILSFLVMLVFGYGMAMFGSALGGGSYLNGTLIISVFIAASLIAASIIWAIWNLKISLRDETRRRKELLQQSSNETNLEKRKRDRIDSVLRDLSDEDLLRLKQRLQDGSIDDDLLEEQIVGDDGELMYMEKNS